MFNTAISFKHAFKAGALVLALALGTGVAKADSVYFAGSTTGGFNSDTPSSMDSYKTLSFAGSSFSGTTSSSGYLAIGGSSGTTSNNFGMFTLSSGNAKYGGTTFTLLIDFTDPAGITGGQTADYFAKVTGSISDNTDGGVTINFNPNSQVFSFSNPNQSGDFKLHLNNLSLNPTTDQSESVTGFLQTSSVVTATPEPNSLMLLGTGFVSAAGMLMRRRKAMSL